MNGTLSRRLWTKRFLLIAVSVPSILLFQQVTLYSDEDPYDQPRKRMVEEQIVLRGIVSRSVIQAMLKVPRHRFVPEIYVRGAYDDTPLPIGYGQTISQPYIVALMTELADIRPEDKVLEIGTGSGYQAAVLAELAREVYSIEILQPLAETADARLRALGYANVSVRCGDGYKGWPEHAPFDAIVVTAAPETIPEELIRQLAVKGRLVIPVGSAFQTLKRIVRTDSGIETEDIIPVRFVPLVRGEKE